MAQRLDGRTGPCPRRWGSTPSPSTPEQPPRLVAVVGRDHDEAVAAPRGARARPSARRAQSQRPCTPARAPPVGAGAVDRGRHPRSFSARCQCAGAIDHLHLGAVEVGPAELSAAGERLLERREVVQVQHFRAPSYRPRATRAQASTRWSPSSGETSAKTRSGTPGAVLEGGVHGTGRTRSGPRPARTPPRRAVVQRAHVHPVEERDARACARRARRASRTPARSAQPAPSSAAARYGPPGPSLRAGRRAGPSSRRRLIAGDSLPARRDSSLAVLRSSRALRTLAWGAVAVGVAAPLVRHRLRLRAPVVTALSFQAPRRARARHPAHARCATPASTRCRCGPTTPTTTCPTTTPTRLLRAHARGLPDPASTARSDAASCPPPGCSARWAGPGGCAAHDLALSWVHWSWFFVPHGTLVYVLVRHPEHYVRSATAHGRDVRPRPGGLLGASHRAALVRGARAAGCEPVRRIMVEAGERFWKRLWRPLYDGLEGNPFAAMPSLHFGTSVMAARVLSDVGRGPGALGWAYALTLGFGLVYLGEHYVVDLLGGLCARGGGRGASRRRRAAAAGGRAGAIQRLEPGARDDGGPAAPERRGRRRSRLRRGGRTRAQSEDAEEDLRVSGMLLRTAASWSRWRWSSSSAIVAIYFVFPKVVGPRRRARPDRRRHVVLDRGRGRVQRRRLRGLRRALPRDPRRAPATSEMHSAASTPRASYQITMAGLAATRIFSAAGAGRDRAHLLGAAQGGHAAPAVGLPDGRLPGAHLLGVPRLRW